MPRRARRGHTDDIPMCLLAERQDRDIMLLAIWVSDRDLPADANPITHRDVTVYVDQCGGVALEASQRSIGDPALGDAIEIEGDGAIPAHHATPSAAFQPPPAPARLEHVAILVLCRKASSQHAHVQRPSTQAPQAVSGSQDRRERRPDEATALPARTTEPCQWFIVRRSVTKR